MTAGICRASQGDDADADADNGHVIFNPNLCYSVPQVFAARIGRGRRLSAKAVPARHP